MRKLSVILSFLRTFGLITVLLLTLPNALGVTGVWLAVPIDRRAHYRDCSTGFSLSEQRKVSLHIIRIK